MAIKAIINNTEKEIEQIKNSDEQDIDYVYSRIGDTEIEGEPPISIKSIGGNLADYRIYGNTVDGESVGDRTGNLFDYKTAIDGYEIRENLIYPNALWCVSDFIPVKPNTQYIGRYAGGAALGYSSKTSSPVRLPMALSSAVTTQSDTVYMRINCLISNKENVMLNEGSTLLPYEPYGYKVPVTVSNGTDTLTTTIYLPEQIKMVGDEAEYIDYAEQKMHRIGADDINVTLPALSTIKGTNTISVNTSIQPSNIYVKDNFDYKKVFTATRTIEGESPLNYRSIEDSDSTLNNYRIYGQTVDGESVGDRTGNLFDGEFLQGYWAYANGEFVKVGTWITTKKIQCKASTEYSFSFSNLSRWYGFVWYDIEHNYISTTNMQNNSTVEYRSYSAVSPPNTSYMIINIAAYPDTLSTITANDVTDFMLVEGSTALPYEPYGYKVPVTVSNGTDTLTTPIYLPEPIKMVGDEAEYVDYKEQKQHRVRKNLWSGVMEQGSVSTTGVYADNTKRVRSRNISIEPGTYTISANLLIRVIYAYNDDNKIGVCIDAPLGTYSQSFTVPAGANNISIGMMKIVNNVEVDITPSDFEWGQIEKGSEVTTYEPYIENTDVDVTLPALPTLTGTNALSVETEAQPSDVYLKGKIKKKPKIYYKIYYYSQDGQTALSTETVEKGHDCTYSTVPTKESDTDFDYTFTGWSTTTNQSSPTSGATTNIQQDTNLYAAFSKSFKTDTISDSWKDIITACNNGTYSGKYQVGDLKTIDVGTEGPVQMQIVAIDTDLLASDNTQTAPITWISKQLLNTSAAMNSTATNYLSDWTNCDMRTYLKNTILPMLPSIVQNNIKEVTKYTNQRTGSTTFTTISSTEDIWLPSYREISSNTSNCETSGVQYNSIFTNNASRVKSKVENSASYWWTRSASGSSNSHYTYYFANVYSNGHANYIGNECPYSHGVAIGFCT